jgi:predicted membrane-bound dolichyl-phosphate-mannose-protein mannosyltransferase
MASTPPSSEPPGSPEAPEVKDGEIPPGRVDTQPSAVAPEPLVTGALDSSIPTQSAPVPEETDLPVMQQVLALVREHGPITAILFVAVFLRAFRLGESKGSLIGDESYYVQAARVIAGYPALMHRLSAASRSGLDPNQEHPPLAKVLIAASMKVLGNREVAFRFPSVILGTLAIWLTYRIILTLHGTRPQACFAAFVLAFDNLFLIHGRTATLDIYYVTFCLLGALLYLEAYIDLAAIAFAIATLCKTNAVLGFFSMFLYDALMARSRWRTPDWAAIGLRVRAGALFGAFFLLGLGALDCFFTAFRGPFEHLAWMGHFHAGLTHKGPRVGTASSPFDWWLNEGNYNYFFVKSKTKNLLFRGMMNGYVIFCGGVALFYAGREAWKRRSPLGAFTIAWVAGNFVPIFMAWAILSRKSYVYYMLPILPGVACGLALASASVPRSTRWGFMALVVYATYFAYPIRYLW